MAQLNEISATLESRCRKWNEKFPIGTEVVYHPVMGEKWGRETRTRSQAYVLSGHTAVIFICGQAGCVALDAIEAVQRG